MRSVKCRVWSGECGVGSVECKVHIPQVTLYKGSISCETSCNLETLTSAKRKGFAASRIDTSKAETCCDTFEKGRFCSFLNQNGEGRGKPETQDETCGSCKRNISCENSSNFDTWTPLKTTSFAASHIDTAKAEEKQRLVTRHVSRIHPIFTL